MLHANKFDLRKMFTRTNWLGVSSFMLILVLLMRRMMQGVDFSDESYYAFFVTDWLYTGIDKSLLITLHETAALIIYPAILLYHFLTGSTDGLFLFLRFLFLFGNVLAAIAWMLFLKRAEYHLLSWVSGFVVLVFIPFALPAPSYNTLAMQGLIIAFAALGLALLAKNPKHFSTEIWLMISALCWAGVTIAYPPLLIALCFTIILFFYLFRSSNYPFLFTIFVAAALILLWGSVIEVLSYKKLYASYNYLQAVNSPLSLNKLQFIVTILLQHKYYIMTCCTLGLFRPYINNYLFITILSILLLLLLRTPPILYAHSHEVITILAITGMARLGNGTNEAARIFALLYFSSLIAACVTGFFALHSLYNFCIGAMCAALLTLLPINSETQQNKWINVLPAIITLCILLNNALLHHYGEIPSVEPRSRITKGIFKGLNLQHNDVAILDIIQQQLTPLLPKVQSIAIIGRLPGIILGLPLNIHMPFVYPLIPPISAKGLAATETFYAEPKNRPDLLLIYRDPYLKPLNPFASHLNDWYIHISNTKTPLGELDIYKERLID